VFCKKIQVNLKIFCLTRRKVSIENISTNTHKQREDYPSKKFFMYQIGQPIIKIFLHMILHIISTNT